MIDFKVGNCLDRLKELQESSVDCMVTDPPYGYSFMGKDWDKVVIGTDVWKECLRVLKPGAFAFVMSAPRQDVLSRMMINLENSGFETGFTSIYWAYATGFPKGMNISKAIDKRKGVEPTKVKKKDYTGPEFADKQFVKQGSMMQTHETAPRIQQWETKPTTEKAKEMEGSYAGFQPKPAVEVIIVCMKPLDKKNYVDQAMSNGKGVVWLNDCRIPYRDKKDIGDPDRCKGYPLLDEKKGWNQNSLVNNITIGEKGRYPANLIVSDNVLDIGKITKSPSGTVNRNEREGSVFTGSSCGFKSETNHSSGFGDEGDFSRYFDIDRWWANFCVTPKASKSEKNKGLDDLEDKEGTKNMMEGTGGAVCSDGSVRTRAHPKMKNHHPTVKPLKLMSYLITLGSRPNDTILDPFSGSGTTCLAANILGRNAIGIELNPEYAKIAKARLEGWN